MSNPLMKCNHTANAIDQDGNPICAICIGIVEGADEVVEHKPDLSGRRARCDYCKLEVQSSYLLAFFKHRPNETRDRFYCGCRGWD